MSEQPIKLKPQYQDNDPLKEVLTMLSKEIKTHETPATTTSKIILLSRLTGTIQGILNFFIDKTENKDEK